MGFGPPSISVQIPNLKLHDLKKSALYELGVGSDRPHHFGQWTVFFYEHWKDTLGLDTQDSLDPFYSWLEIELHRPIREPAIQKILDEKVTRGKQLDTFDTTKHNLNLVERFLAGVKYFTTKAEREKYLVREQGGILFRRNVQFDTEHYFTVASNKGWAIWVRSPDGTFYSHSHKAGRFHHSSFLAGGDVLGAGEWLVTHGKIHVISGKSGHYFPTMEALWDSAHELKNLNVFHSAAKVRLYQRGGGAKIEIDYHEFLNRKPQDLLETYLVDKMSLERDPNAKTSPSSSDSPYGDY